MAPLPPKFHRFIPILQQWSHIFPYVPDFSHIFPIFFPYLSHFVRQVATEQQERDQAVGREVILEQELRAERRRRIDMEAQVTLADSWKAMAKGGW